MAIGQIWRFSHFLLLAFFNETGFIQLICQNYNILVNEEVLIF